jgi:hypothetical protein
MYCKDLVKSRVATTSASSTAAMPTGMLVQETTVQA